MSRDPDLKSLPPLKEVIRRHGLSARRPLGQHFLLDLNLTRRIAAAAGDIGDGIVLEVGPGPGGLTRALLERGARLDPAENRGRTALMIAAERDHPEIVRLLIEAGADVARADKEGLTAAQLAASDAVRAT